LNFDKENLKSAKELYLQDKYILLQELHSDEIEWDEENMFLIITKYGLDMWIVWKGNIFYIQKGKFHVEMTSTTPSGSGTISTDDGYIVIEVFT